MIDYTRIPFVAAHPNRFRSLVDEAPRPLDLIVIHDMEAPESSTTAENVARWFATDPMPQTSAHYCIDSDSIVQCVQIRDIAFAAPGANRKGVHLELAGYARQSREEWLDPFGVAMLGNAAKLISLVIAPKGSIPLVFVDAAGLLAGHRGITTHAEVTKAFGKSTHTDPGPNFPLDRLLEMVRS